MTDYHDTIFGLIVGLLIFYLSFNALFLSEKSKKEFLGKSDRDKWEDYKESVRIAPMWLIGFTVIAMMIISYFRSA